MNNSSHHQDDVVLTHNGEVYNPIDLDDNFLIITKFVCCSIGIPLNLSIAFTIVHRRRLHRKPRNIFLLGIIFSYLAFFVPSVIKLICWAVYPTESVCLGYVAVVGVPQGLLLLNMLLALIDRYMAINHPLLHREKMNVRSAAVLIVIGSLVVVFLLKFIFIVHIIAPLRCEVCLVHVKLVLIVLSVLSLACTVFNFIVYRQTKDLLAESRRLTLVSSNVVTENDEDVEWIELGTIGNDSRINHRASSASGSLTTDHSTQIRTIMSIHVNKKKLSRIELEATRTLITGVTSLVVMALPPTIFVSIFLGCKLFFEAECSSLNWLSPYMIELGLIHAVYNPLIFIVRNKELRSMRTALTCQKYQGYK
jgi:dopamine receptor D1